MAELANGSTIAGKLIWHEGNDGSGSGLDADKIDGIEGVNLAKTRHIYTPSELNNNTTLESGFYTVSNGSDLGLDSHWYHIINMKHFDGTLNKYLSISEAKVLGYYGEAYTHPYYDYFATNSNLTHTDDILSISIDTAKQYDLIIVDKHVWRVSSTIISKLKEFVDAGISCFATGNDTRTNIFVKSYDTSLHQAHDIKILTDKLPANYNDSDILIGKGSWDVYGGIVELQNGAFPIYKRTDGDLIMGYMYISSSGAVFYFDQEGVNTFDNIFPIFKPCIQYAINCNGFNAQIAVDLSYNEDFFIRFATAGTWSEWDKVPIGNCGKITISSSAPISPKTNDIWIDTSA